jgi:very-short-patch-repair endonuclease
MSPQNVHGRICSGRWERVLPGVFRVTGAPNSWRQALMASCLWLPEAVASHGAAAVLWDFDGFREDVIEISTTSPAKAPRSWVSVHRVSRLDPVDIVRVGPIPTTSPTRTIVDLCGVLDRDRAENAIDDALRRGLTTVPRLRWALRRLGRRGRPGTRLARQLLLERMAGYVPLESPLERRLLRLLAGARLPSPSVQHEVRRRGRLIARVDLAYPDARLAIEADGYRYHAGKAMWQRDLSRRNALLSCGWNILHVTWDDVHLRPEKVVEDIRRLISGSSLRNGSS